MLSGLPCPHTQRLNQQDALPEPHPTLAEADLPAVKTALRRYLGSVSNLLQGAPKAAFILPQGSLVGVAPEGDTLAMVELNFPPNQKWQVSRPVSA